MNKQGATVILIMLFFIVCFAVWFFWQVAVLNGTCLAKYGVSYCDNQNKTYSSDAGLFYDFRCYDYGSRRIDYQDYQYLPEEKQNCIIKDRFTFQWRKE